MGIVGIDHGLAAGDRQPPPQRYLPLCPQLFDSGVSEEVVQYLVGRRAPAGGNGLLFGDVRENPAERRQQRFDLSVLAVVDVAPPPRRTVVPPRSLSGREANRYTE